MSSAATPSNDEEAPFLNENERATSNNNNNNNNININATITLPRVISIAASVSMLAVAGVALFHSLDINDPGSMKTMTSLGKAISTNSQTNLFDTIVTDLEQGILSAEEAMGIYNPNGEECILRPHENMGKRCKSTSGYTKFNVKAINGQWPKGFSWTILQDEGDGEIGKGLLHTETGEMSDETAKKKCASFVTEVCAPDKFIVYASSDEALSEKSTVDVCGKSVADGEALDFTDSFFSCRAGVDITGDARKNLLAGLAAPSLSGAPHMVSGSLSGVSGSMNYGSSTPSESTDGSDGTDGTDGTDGSESTNTPSTGGDFQPTEPTDDAPTEGGVERTQISSEGTDYKICNVNNIPRSYLVDGVTVGPGCLALADKDLTTIPENPQYTHANLVVICGNKDSGTVQLDAETLNAYDLIYEGQSLLSSMLLDKACDVKYYLEDGFTGLSKHYNGTKGNGMEWSHANEPFTFAGQKYSSTVRPFKNVGDNVKSLEFTSTTDELTDCGSYAELKRYFKKDKKKLQAAMDNLKLKSESTQKTLNLNSDKKEKKEKAAKEKKLAYEKLYKKTMAKKKKADKKKASKK